MSRPTKIPSYRKHKNSGQAVVTLTVRGKRHDVFLGRYGSPESHREYARVIAEWTGTIAGPVSASSNEFSVNELVLAFWKFANTFYCDSAGRPTSEVHNYRAVIRTLRILYGHVAAIDFGPVALKAVRQHWVTAGIVRSQVNARVYRVRRIFRWAVAEQLLPPTSYEALRAVEGLKVGRTDARESTPVLPVPDEMVTAVMPYMPTMIRDMVSVQQLTAMRPGEVCQLRWSEIDRSSPVWCFRPGKHKTSHHEKNRIIFIGPKAQVLLNEYLDGSTDIAFSPRKSESVRQCARSNARKTPRYSSHMKRNATKRKTKPRRSAGDCYTEAAYRRAIARACEMAWPPPNELRRKRLTDSKGRPVLESVSTWKSRLGPTGLAELAQWRADHSWSPHQLRHSAATRIRQRFGIEATRTVLGHSDIDTSEIYAERDQELARRVAAEVG